MTNRVGGKVRRTEDPFRAVWGAIISAIGLVLVLSSTVWFIMSFSDDDVSDLLKAIYTLLLGMGTYAFGEYTSRSRTSSTKE